MKYLNKLLASVLVVSLTVVATGCEKFLAEKTSKKLVVPEHLEDLQALMDNYNYTNLTGPSAGAISSDDYYLTDRKFDALVSENDRRMYLWKEDNVFSTTGFNNWTDIYNSIYYSNTVLLGLEKIPRIAANQSDWDNIKGQALFCRGNNLLDGAMVWCLAYDESSASTDLGLPLRLNTDFNEVSRRSNVRQTYDQILSDLKGAAALLPVLPLSKYRSSKAAAYGLLSRTYLFMRNYPQAKLYADSCLELQGELLDYNDLILTANYPLNPAVNPEFLYARYIKSSPILSTTNPVSPSELYDSFNANDLRKRAFFATNTDGTVYFKGSYFGLSSLFGGIATDEVLLIKAECLARAKSTSESMVLINKLMLKRWDKSKPYSYYSTSDPEEAKQIVLAERRKELMMRGLRWMDIKRLNKEGENISLTRIIHGETYILRPNDLKYALPIPEDVIRLSGMEQNRR